MLAGWLCLCRCWPLSGVVLTTLYLKALPSVEPSRTSSAPSKVITQSKRDGVGAKLYARHCANCHGENGEGKADAFPALAGNRAVLMANATNVIAIILARRDVPREIMEVFP